MTYSCKQGKKNLVFKETNLQISSLSTAGRMALRQDEHLLHSGQGSDGPPDTRIDDIGGKIVIMDDYMLSGVSVPRTIKKKVPLLHSIVMCYL